MKQRKAVNLRDLQDEELEGLLKESIETLTKNRFQAAMSQLTDTSYIKVIRKDIARIKTILHERKTAQNKGN